MSIICALEIGNTSIDCAFFDGERIAARFRLRSNTQLDDTQYHRALVSGMSAAQIDAHSVAQTFISSVVPSLTPVVAGAARLLMNGTPHIIDGHSILGITVRRQNRDELGCDIVLNLAEAWERNGHRASIVVDFGTALTTSAVDHDGVVCGVAIAPGISTALRSLVHATARLPHIPLHFPPSCMGTDTVTALQSGIMYGYCGLVGELVRGFQRELGERAGSSDNHGMEARVIATGGYGGIIHTRVPEITEYRGDLTVRGLLRVGRLNTQVG